MHKAHETTVNRRVVNRSLSLLVGALVFASAENANAKPPAPPPEEAPATGEPSAPKIATPPGQASAAQTSASDSDLQELESLSLEVLLETKVVTATKTARTVEEAPAVVSVVTREDIARWGYQSLSEALQHVVGFYIIDDHAIANAGVRGISGGLFGESSGIKLMIDGHSVAFRPTGGNWLGPELVPLSAVERVEI
ncbi:MAG TPA: TonB-dependent receptor plug domain-containing protein, partial [Polyangiaceae bacterium]|nr:TonB-dependent receptor plug domain-containing protein [Polyangiaceae bacterium]